MPDPNPIQSLYPAPPQLGQNALSNPWQAVYGLSTLQANQRANALFNAQRAAGAAFQGAYDPTTGQLDAGKAISGLQSPDAALVAPQMFGDLNSQRTQMQDLATKQFGLASAQSDYLSNRLGAWATDPNITPDQVRSDMITAARLAHIPPGMATAVLSSMPTSGKPGDINAWAAHMGLGAIGAAGANAPQQGPPGPGGEPTAISAGQGAVVRAGGGPMSTALPPGQSEAIAANRASFVNDQQRSATTLANLRPLQNALPLLQQMSASDFGPGSQGFSQVKSALITVGVIPPNATDTEVRQEANKYLHVYAGGARGAERSDQGLSQAIASNPKLDLTQGANLALVKNQIGMDRMDAALPQAFSVMHPGDAAKANYGDYKSQFYQTNDPRAFSWDIMTPEERRTVIDSFPKGKNGQPDQTSQAFQKFAKSYALAKATKMIQPPGAQNGPQQ